MWRSFTFEEQRLARQRQEIRRVIITDVTRMKPPRVCIAGHFEDNLEPVRPVIPYEGIKEEFLYHEGELIVKPFSIIEFRFLRHEPDPPHTEDWAIDPGHKRLVGHLATSEERIRLLERVEDRCVKEIFGADIYHAEEGGYYVKQGQGARSLGTIAPDHISYISYKEVEPAKWDYRVRFIDQCGEEFRLPVTDLDFRRYCDDRRGAGEHPDKIALDLKTRLNRCKLYLRIGLAREWPRFPDRCYLQVTAIYSIPSYLEGESLGRAAWGQEDEVPF